MEDSVLFMLLLQAALIACNAIFACAEIAVISLSDSRLAKLASEGDKRAVRLSRLTEQPARFLATIQVAITLSGFLGSAFAAENFSDELVALIQSFGVRIPAATLDAIAVVLITLVLSYVTLIFGELVPKRVAMQKAEALALGMSGLISLIAKLFAPIVWLLTNSTNAILRLLGIDPNADEEDVSEESIRMMVDAGSEKGAIDNEEKEFIQNVFEFDDLTASDIATHRTDVEFLWMDETMEEWKETIYKSRHSLFPICEETADKVVGILNAKDYFRIEDKSRENVMKKAVKPAYFVPDSVKADVLFRNMKRNRSSFAVVLDEYGGMTGIVTMNDLLEQLVGELSDDALLGPEPAAVEKLDVNTWKVSGSASLEEVSEALEMPLESDEYDTFNGLVFEALGSVPQDGTQTEVETAGLSIKVMEIREHQVVTALVSKLEKARTDSDEAETSRE